MTTKIALVCSLPLMIVLAHITVAADNYPRPAKGARLKGPGSNYRLH